jgi:Phosphotransferase enzyme family.
MDSVAYNLQFEKLFKTLGLGRLRGSPEQIYGGHLHRMYSVNTTSGKYAVKALNPQVMLRPEAKPNIINAERIAQIASKYVPAAQAKVFESGFMPEIDGQYYLVFDWIDGRTIYSNELTIQHCRRMGGIFADIHKIDFSTLGLIDDYYKDEKLTDWNDYLNKGKEYKAPWLDLFSQNIDNLFNWNNRLIHAAKRLASEIVISHGDLEPKKM